MRNCNQSLQPSAPIDICSIDPILKPFFASTGNSYIPFLGTMASRYLSDFGGKKILAPLIDAAALSPLVSDLDHRPHAQDAASTIWEYLRTTNTPDQIYVSSVLSDIPLIERFVTSNRVQPNEDPCLAKALTADEDVEVEQGLFGAPTNLIPPKKILEFLEKDINIESAVMGSAGMLTVLGNEGYTDAALLQHMTDAQSFYGTVCDLIGFDALSMALRSRGYLIALKKLKQQESIGSAERLLEQIGDRDSYATSTQEMLTIISGGADVDITFPISDTTGHGIIVSEIKVGDTRAAGRVKSLGSLGLKFSRGRIPMDITGTSIIVNNELELAVRYGEYVARAKRLHDAGAIKLQGPPRKSSPFSIQGHPDFIDHVLEVAKIHRRDVWEIRNASYDDYKTAKLTFFHTTSVNGKDWPVRNELKFETYKSRIQSRIGKASHIFYEAQKTERPIEIKPKHLKKIHARRHHLNTESVNPASRERGKDLVKLVRSMAI